MSVRKIMHIFEASFGGFRVCIADMHTRVFQHANLKHMFSYPIDSTRK